MFQNTTELNISPEGAAHLLPVIFKITAVLNDKTSYNRRLDAILEIVLQYLGVEQGSIMLLEKKSLVVQASSKRSEIIGHRQPLTEKSIASWVATNRKPLFIEDISKDSRFSSCSCKKVYRTNALLSVPIMHQGRLIGVFNITDKAKSKNLLKEDIILLMQFSSFVLSLMVQQNMHKELQERKNRLRKQHLELKRQEAKRAELSRMLIHDLKGPLSEVVANLDIMSYSIDKNNREFLENALMSCDRAIRMAANLATAAKIEDGAMQIIREKINTDELLSESAASLRGLTKINNAELVIDPQSREDTYEIKIDRVLILRVLQNLIINALSHSETRTVITIGCRKIAARKQLEFFVKDQGPGIPEERQEQIFEKYARLSDKQNALTGTGLGLYFCRLAVEAHNGRIGVKNNPEGGSLFYFVIPIRN